MPPRSSLRQRNATPAASTPLPNTPAGKRSTRAASRQPVALSDVVSNPALPEIQTQQSYAYGSSKAPALPEQLNVRDLSMNAVANRLKNAADEAEKNFEARAAEVRDSTPESQISARDVRAHRRAKSQKQSSIPPTDTPDEVRRQHRIAAWVDSSQLDDITEEDSREDPDRRPKTPRRREDSLPSSFPTGSFDHSYGYEKGERRPNLPLSEPNVETESESELDLREVTPQPESRQESMYTRMRTSIQKTGFEMVQHTKHSAQAMWHWISRIGRMMQKSLLEIPDSPITSIFFKTFIMVTVTSVCGLLFCTIFSRTCDVDSTSIISQTLQNLCGQCSTSSSLHVPNWNFTSADANDMNMLIAALKKTQAQINQIESRLNSRIDSHSADTTALRTHQEALESQIRKISQRRSTSSSGDSSSTLSNEIPSPLIAKLNFFSPSSGAIIIPRLTSPTRAEQSSFLYRFAQRTFGIRKILSPPPVTALEPWLDEGDCWCAAETSTAKEGEDVLRLAIQTIRTIYPTELVIEHFPSSGTLQPGTAPRDLELWADFADLTYPEWQKLHITDLISESPDQDFIHNNRQRTWARIGTAIYTSSGPSISSVSQEVEDGYVHEVRADEPFAGRRGKNVRSDSASQIHDADSKTTQHVQRFSLQINQNGLLHYSDRFLVRVKRNWGASYTCLYRARLHGLPFNHVDEQAEQ